MSTFADEREDKAMHKFRWRVIPVTLLFFFGPILLVSALFGATAMVYANWTYGWITPDPNTPSLNTVAFTFTNIGMWIVTLCTGTICLFAGYAWLKGRWGIATTSTAIIIIVHVSFTLFSGH